MSPVWEFLTVFVLAVTFSTVLQILAHALLDRIRRSKDRGSAEPVVLVGAAVAIAKALALVDAPFTTDEYDNTVCVICDRVVVGSTHPTEGHLESCAWVSARAWTAS